MGKRRVSWHEGFFEAMKLVLHRYQDALEFVSEHQLSQEALKIDILVIKKAPDVAIEIDIGRIFRNFNVVEYKSERDSLTVRDYHKVLGYALLYSSFERVALSDMTVTFAVTMRPRELLKHVSAAGLAVREAGEGITYIEGGMLPVQILECKKLSEDENLFIRGLRRGNKTEDLLKILGRLDNQQGLNMKNAYIDRLRMANMEAFEEVLSVNDSWKEMFFRLAEKDGWLEMREREVRAATARVTAREAATRMLGFGLPIEQICIVTQLPAEEIMELAREAETGLLA